MAESLRILVVCAANVCRSPLAGALLERWAVHRGEPDLLSVGSAGILAEEGQPMCVQAGGWAGRETGSHGSRPVTADLVAEADLVLAAERTHRAALARLDVRSRSRLFTLRQAGQIGAMLSRTIRAGALPEGAAALPHAPAARLRWLVGELDAARYLLAGQPEADADILDTHGPSLHDSTFTQVEESVAGLTGAMDACLDATALV